VGRNSRRSVYHSCSLHLAVLQVERVSSIPLQPKGYARSCRGGSRARGFVLNRRTEPVGVEYWGVMRRKDAPRRLMPAVVREDLIDRKAFFDLADVNGARPLRVLDPGSFIFLRTLRLPEANTRIPEPKYLAWHSNDRLVPFILIPGVGWIFGMPTSGPWSRSDYPGFPCRSCSHDQAHHQRRYPRGWRALSVRLAACEMCRCRRFEGAVPPASARER
jgi:hypothetical protein